MEKFRITIASPPDRKYLIAEILYEGVQWAEISQERGELVIQFYSHPYKDFWEFPLEEAIQILERAKTKLLIRKNNESFLSLELSVDVKHVNEQGQQILESIVDHPESKSNIYESGRYGKTLDIYSPTGQGARCTLDGEFIGFLEPRAN